jgi:hypothetical protein
MNKTVFVQKVILTVPDAIVLLILALSFMKGSITIGAIVTALYHINNIIYTHNHTDQ